MTPPRGLAVYLSSKYTQLGSGKAHYLSTLVRLRLRSATSMSASPILSYDLIGGPGETGVGYVALDGMSLMNTTGGNYDIVSWDPRGVGSLTM